jgi:MFS family permease
MLKTFSRTRSEVGRVSAPRGAWMVCPLRDPAMMRIDGNVLPRAWSELDLSVPLRRNRDFLLFQSGQLLSSFGTQTAQIAYPLLALALTGSASKAGLVAFARALPFGLFALPTGLAADHFSRKRLMITADVIRVLAVGALAAAIIADAVTFWALVAVAFLEGAAATLFVSSSSAALRAVVPRSQLPNATSVITARVATVRLGGPPLGGALFGIARSLPFVVDAVSYAFSTASLLAMKTPFEEERTPDTAPLRTRLVEGVRFLWRIPLLRTLSFIFALANFILPGVTLALVVIGTRQGLTGGEIGLLVAAFGACLLLGSLIAPWLRRRLPPRVVIVLELWTWAGCGVFLIYPSVYALAAGILPTALAVPTTDSVVMPYMLSLTPDRLVGRTQAAFSTVSQLVMPLGSLAAGLLLANVSERATIALFTAFGLALALWGTLSPAIRAAPSLSEL